MVVSACPETIRRRNHPPYKTHGENDFSVTPEARVVLLGCFRAPHILWPRWRCGGFSNSLTATPFKEHIHWNPHNPHTRRRCVFYESPRGDSALNPEPWSQSRQRSSIHKFVLDALHRITPSSDSELHRARVAWYHNAMHAPPKLNPTTPTDRVVDGIPIQNGRIRKETSRRRRQEVWRRMSL